MIAKSMRMSIFILMITTLSMTFVNYAYATPLSSSPDWLLIEDPFQSEDSVAWNGMPISESCLYTKMPGGEISYFVRYFVRKGYKIGPEVRSGNWSDDLENHFLAYSSQYWSQEISPFITEEPEDFSELFNKDEFGVRWNPIVHKIGTNCSIADQPWSITVLATFKGADCSVFFNFPVNCEFSFQAAVYNRDYQIDGSGFYAILSKSEESYLVPIEVNSTEMILQEPPRYK